MIRLDLSLPWVAFLGELLSLFGYHFFSTFLLGCSWSFGFHLSSSASTFIMFYFDEYHIFKCGGVLDIVDVTRDSYESRTTYIVPLLPSLSSHPML